MKWLSFLIFFPLSASLRHYQYDPGRSTKSRWIKNCWPKRPSPAQRIFNLHVLRDHLKHTAKLRRTREALATTVPIRPRHRNTH